MMRQPRRMMTSLTSFVSVVVVLSRPPFTKGLQQRRCPTFHRAPWVTSVMMQSSTSLPETGYRRLASILQDVSSLEAVSGLLVWDEQVMMPPGSAEFRAAQKAALVGVIHERETSDALCQAIHEARDQWAHLDEWQRAVVRDAERNWQLAHGVSVELERSIAEQETLGVQAWVDARKKDEWKSFAPHLHESVRLAREYAQATRPNLPTYDALIDIYERGMTSERLATIFDQIEKPLRKLLQEILTASSNNSVMDEIPTALEGSDHWNVDDQATLCRSIAGMLGYDFQTGRIDVSAHPFTGGPGPQDVRITTRYSTGLPFEGIMGTIHEAGHAMYEQGRNKVYTGLPVSEPVSTGVHESQSLFWERMIGQSKEFWDFLLPSVHETFPHTKMVSSEDFYRAINRVRRSLIRVDADEVTYPFHVILRFKVEKALFDGSIDVDELPTVWARLFEELIGIPVPTDREGCLQDVHWASGAFGYFPSYTLGAMMAAQLFHHLESQAMPDIRERTKNGDFTFIRDWLHKEIHSKGSLHPSLDELLESATGEPLNPDYFLEYLRQKYSVRYGFA
uniref:Carboxypeptidase M32 n=1 Tax=Compsopogon caeruleus TaxID=31354 RepID=A0A7S1XG35_9RHOD|mmetsp:Transcript_8206/g.16606  ORF Transcript_8206/g.16606 Transcript_8206/m.16606 type:complete len:565 (+) Transcript_8206:438-2132(+)